ncbi:MAG TPA: DUF202 domain-containing protein [Propionicimonas sp.]|nr:DUF202 domain-containing protein [Propionicimonas sp.]
MSESATTPAGLQPERTALAWQRTALALLGLGLASPRLTWGSWGAWSLLPALVVVVGSVAILARSHRRYRTASHLLKGRPAGLRLDGRLPLLTAVLALIVAVMALVLL